MNPDLDKLQPYPFEKLIALKAGCTPPAELAHIALSIGEPKHPAPAVALDAIRDHLQQLNQYPVTRGSGRLRQTIRDWLQRRFELPDDSIHADEHVIPVNGTREALFAFAQSALEHNTGALVLMPNPFYQIYEGAARSPARRRTSTAPGRITTTCRTATRSAMTPGNAAG